MSALRVHKSALTESAVSETVRRVNAKVVALLTRRAEINRRIRSLHRVVQGLRDLGTAPAFSRGLETHVRPSECLPDRAQATMAGEAKSSARYQLAGLSRACRIALMETETGASLRELQARIDRRGSFAFSGEKYMDEEITQALNAMMDSGEVACVKNGSVVVWQRILPNSEIDN